MSSRLEAASKSKKRRPTQAPEVLKDGRAKGWLCHRTKRKMKRNKVYQRAPFLDKMVESSYLKIISHSYLCINNQNNKSALSGKWQMLVQVSEEELWACQKPVPNVLLLNSEASFRAAVPRSQGRRLEVWGPGDRSPLLASGSLTSCARHAGQAIVSMHSRSSKRAKGKPQSTKNICSVPCPECRRRLRGDSAAQLQDVYSKLSSTPPPRAPSLTGFQAPTSEEGTLNLGVLTLNCIPA